MLDPMLWVLIILALAWIARNRQWKKRLYTIAILLFLFFSNGWIINNIWYRYQWQPVDLKQEESYAAGILLGGLAGYDEYRKRGVFNMSSDRFIQAARLYETGRIRSIMVTGGNSIFVKESGYNEADFIVQNLGDLQIPASKIFVEKKARNTKENAAFSKPILDSAGLRGPYLIITSAIHMPRAMKVFEKAGLDVRPFPCNYMITEDNTKFTLRNLMPSGSSFENWKSILKEWIGILLLAAGK
jgi:uncharacterized SAM-binding protein YcdF (DUF218 family)